MGRLRLAGFLAAVQVVSTAGFFLLTRPYPLLSFEHGKLGLIDYAYHIRLHERFWFGGGGNIYGFRFQADAMASELGVRVDQAMPEGVSPTALVVWLPFAALAHLSLRLGYAAWVGFSLTALLAALLAADRLRRASIHSPLFAAALGVGIFSFTFAATLVLGQTSLAGAAALLALAALASDRRERRVAEAVLIFALSVKLPYLAIGCGILLLAGRWRSVAAGIGLSVAAGLAVLPGLGWAAVPDFVDSLRMLSRGEFPPHYAQAVAVVSTNTPASAFGAYVPVSGLIRVSGWIYPAAAAFGLLGLMRPAAARNRWRLAFFAAYALFAPYAGGYEDLLLISAAGAAALGGCRTDWGYALPAAATLAIVLNRGLLLGTVPAPAFWLLKAAYFVLLWVATRRTVAHGGVPAEADAESAP